MTTQAICNCEGIYALTYGKQYKLLGLDSPSGQVKVRCDNRRVRWLPASHFQIEGKPNPVLVRWQFDDPSIDPVHGGSETDSLLEVSFWLSDRTHRWCFFVTPRYLGRELEDRSDPEQWTESKAPGLCAAHMIVVRDLRVRTVDWMLRFLDRKGELVHHSLPMEEEE